MLPVYFLPKINTTKVVVTRTGRIDFVGKVHPEMLLKKGKGRGGNESKS